VTSVDVILTINHRGNQHGSLDIVYCKW